MHAACDRVTVFRVALEAAVLIAPVGHDLTHSSHATQRAKSIAGNPNAVRVS
jgi:hypothetical protein